ncbi:WXG100 family type VII secretion target [Paenibacillus sp. 1781tsa1]|uniref:WXG100 family type VII secretion target n=1 Tax=Paenibacillus sp. 1781tsa1 TaxID=2953810 RepID=UPI00209E5C6B|nr:WXG100 family type VII secretion target [Paenibacillus sp. 1781tsa1]MCP1187463.1 WXG100 family type VII secretion target [Paenibacillus sp. 1781tsa1]
MSTIKVTPEQLHHVSNQVDQARQQLESIRSELTRQIMFVQMMWMGATQERFYYEFEQSRPILDKALESMVNTSKELKDIATRFQDADAQKGSLGGAFGAVGAAAMMTKSSGESSSGDKGYRMAQINMFGKLVWMPVNENGVADQAALQAYQRDQGNLDFNRMQAVNVEPPGEDIFALQIKAFEMGIHPTTGEPVSDKYAQMMVTSLKFSQVFMGIQMVRGSMPGGKGPFRLPASNPAVVKIKQHIEAAKAKNGSIEKNALEATPKATEQRAQLSQNLIDHVINRHSVNSTKQQLPYLQKKMSDEQINEMLSRKSFFNKEWSDNKITDASTEAVNQLKQQGIKDGLHTVTVFDEQIKVFIRNDNVDSVYGTHIYKISDLID